MNRRSQQRCPFAWLVCAFTTLTLFGLPTQAQPSGGPYGPIQRDYEATANAGHVYYVAPDGREDAAGTSLDQPTTLEAAISKVVTRDAIILRGGTYRTGNLTFNQGIVMQPYAGERPVLKGTRVATEWRALPNKVWRTSWKTLFPAAPLGWWQRDREGVKTPLHRFNNDMVFVDGEMLRSAGWEGELDAHSYYIDYEKGQVYIGVDPANRLVEITAFDGALIRTTSPVHGKTNDHVGPVIRGITFTQYAWRALVIEGKRSFGPNDEPTDEPIGPSDPATYGKEVTGTIIENVTVSFCSRVAGFFRGDGLTIRQSLFSDTSTEGVYVIGSSDVLLERNIFRRNNVENLTGYYPAAVKIFNQSHRVTCRDNLVMDNPNSNGIWYDVGNRDGVFVDNWVQDCQDGFFFEISKGAVCAGNVFVNCDKGIRVLNSSNVRAWHNTLIDSVASFERNERSATGDHFGWHPATGPDVDQREGHVFCGNLLVASERFSKPLVRFEQSRAVSKLTEPQVTQFDGNVYVRSDAANPAALLVWSPSPGNSGLAEFKTLADFQKLCPQFEVHSEALTSPLGSLFQSPDLRRYGLIQDISVPASAIPMPDEIRQQLGWQKQDTVQPGAYPVRP
ncbi:MAG: right-handed parallel beta-helix repeat-containing protein [Phycisphaerales bacterium]